MVDIRRLILVSHTACLGALLTATAQTNASRLRKIDSLFVPVLELSDCEAFLNGVWCENQTRIILPRPLSKRKVTHGIKWLQKHEIIVDESLQGPINELNTYQWKKDKDGESLNVPIDFNNHAMDAIRYGIYTHCKKRAFGFGVM